MEQNFRLQISKSIIHYLLESTNYTIKNIADLCNASITHIRSIYSEGHFVLSAASELKLINLYHIILELNLKKNKKTGT